ncbi:MAG: hypothetical protein HS109_20250 [Burkholderiales bacterium]|nr:hypothetical protein [Burkholderiales bacterium]
MNSVPARQLADALPSAAVRLAISPPDRQPRPLGPELARAPRVPQHHPQRAQPFDRRLGDRVAHAAHQPLQLAIVARRLDVGDQQRNRLAERHAPSVARAPDPGSYDQAHADPRPIGRAKNAKLSRIDRF